MSKVDLAKYFKRFKPDSTHHLAAVNELQRLMPPELLDRKAEWISIFEAATSEEL